MTTEEGSLGDPFDYDDPDATLDELTDDIAGPSSSTTGQTVRRERVSGRKTPATRLKNAQADKAEQSNDLRGKFFREATICTGAVLAANFVIFTLYIISEWNEISDAVMLAWISATVVEVLGIIYIIARYLFDDRSSESSADNS